LGRIFGPRRVDGTRCVRKLHNYKFDHFYCLTNIIGVRKEKKIKRIPEKFRKFNQFL